MRRSILRYRATMAAKQAASTVLAAVPQRPLPAQPAVTLFISSMNTLLPLRLTIESLVRHTKYPNYRLLIGENASTDGSREYLESLRDTLPITIINAPKPRMHADWLNEVAETVDTPYWCAIDSDMLFVGTDWLQDMIRIMETKPDLFLLYGETVKAAYNYVEPVGGETIDAGERPSAWLLCMRTALRDRMKIDFNFVVDKIDPATGKKFCYDTGGKVMDDMTKNGLQSAPMPSWFLCKFHHFGNLSWGTRPVVGVETSYQALKRFQFEEIKHRLDTAKY